MKTCSACHVNYPDAVEFCPRDGNKLPPNPHETKAMYDPLIGSTIDGRYIIEAVLGQGGMGTVYAGRHAIIDKRVAIKVLKSEHAGDASAVERFLVEAKAASKIGHQNIVDITDFGVLPDGHAYFVMEFLDGPTLGKIVHESGNIDPKRTIAIAVQIARGLQAAHDKGIIHRDLKPENIFVLEKDGEQDIIKIVDFGIARDTSHKKRLTQAGMVLGTPEYMSPEQATGQPTDHRVDLYALGCIMYEMLTGEVPYKGETATKTLTMHVFDKVTPPTQRRPDLHIPPALEAVVMKTIEKKPDDRFPDLRAMMSELDKVDAELRSSKPQTSAASRIPMPSEDISHDTDAHEPVDMPRPSRRPIYIVAGTVAAAAAVVAIALVAGGKKPKVVAMTTPAQPAPAVLQNAAPPSSAPAQAAPAPAKDVELVLRSDPAGAEIFDGLELLGTAPVTLHRPHSDRALELTFKRAGYQEVRRDIVPDRDRDVEVVLVKHVVAHGTKTAQAKPAARTPAAAQPKQTPAQPKRQSDLRNPFE